MGNQLKIIGHDVTVRKLTPERVIFNAGTFFSQSLTNTGNKINVQYDSNLSPSGIKGQKWYKRILVSFIIFSIFF